MEEKEIISKIEKKYKIKIKNAGFSQWALFEYNENIPLGYNVYKNGKKIHKNVELSFIKEFYEI